MAGITLARQGKEHNRAYSEQQFHKDGSYIPSLAPYGCAEVAKQYMEYFNLRPERNCKPWD